MEFIHFEPSMEGQKSLDGVYSWRDLALADCVICHLDFLNRLMDIPALV